jgi:hypothetical protein
MSESERGAGGREGEVEGGESEREREREREIKGRIKIDDKRDG